MPRYFYYSDIKSFLGESLEQIFGKLSRNDEYDTAATQKYAWEQEIVVMKQVLETCWNRIKKAERKSYQLNAYRVLLTRARQGMVICVPEGDPNDHTRQPEFYDGTYKYLRRLGFKEI